MSERDEKRTAADGKVVAADAAVSVDAPAPKVRRTDDEEMAAKRSQRRATAYGRARGFV